MPLDQDRYQLFPGTFWEQIYEQRWEAGILNDQQMRPIVPQDIPVIPDGHILACYAFSDAAPDRWTSAGSFQQVYASPTFSEGKLLAGRYKVWLRQTTLLELTDRGSSYQLKYYPPRWLEDVRVILWQYTGATTNALALELDQLNQQIASLRVGRSGEGGQGNGPDGAGPGLSGAASFDNLDGGLG